MHSSLRLLTMWADTRAVALMAMTAALYAAAAMPTKLFQVLPGFLDVRPAAAVPLALAALLGAPACWGAAVGNLVQDLLGGQIGPGSAVGFTANFLQAWVAWRVAAALGLHRHLVPGASRFAAGWRFGVGAILGAATCGLSLGWGLDTMGSAPYGVIAPFVFANNAVCGLLLGPLLVFVLARRVHRWHLADPDLAPDAPPPSRGRVLPGLVLLAAGSLGGLLALHALLVAGASLALPGGVALALLLAGLLLL